MLLIALDEPALHKVRTDLLEAYAIDVHCLGINLTDHEAPGQIYDWCQSNQFQVDTLINNAGIGNSGLFENNPLKDYIQMIRLNNQAVVGLTHYFLPDLKRQASAYILNVSSMEATLPLPYKAVYTGTKNFIYAFSMAISEELKSSDVQVSVLCPGPVLTNPAGLQRIQSQGLSARLLLMMPEEVARIAIRKMLRGQRIIIPGKLPFLIVKFLNLLPEAIKMSILERIFRVYRDLPGDSQGRLEEI